MRPPVTDGSFDWRAALRQIDPQGERLLGDLLAHLTTRESSLPRKQKELILMACAAARRSGSEVRRHGLEAMYYGATDAEIVEALALAAAGGGAAALGDALTALGDQLTLNGEG